MNIRDKYIKIRKNINNKEDKSNIITNKIINNTKYINSSNIALYKSLDSEVNLDYLINYSLDNNKKVYLPKVDGDKLTFYEINKNTKYVKSEFGVLEPIGDKIMNSCDLIIVPGVVFDKNNNRMGFGKGYYDRFLCNKKIYKIGVCFKEQIVKNIEVNEWDIKMDEVITD